MYIKYIVGIISLILSFQAVPGTMQAVVCKRNNFNFIFGPIPAKKDSRTITSIWLKGNAENKRYALGHVIKSSPNGDLMLRVADPIKDKPGSSSIIIYTAGLHQAVFIVSADPSEKTMVGIAHCKINNVPKSANH